MNLKEQIKEIESLKTSHGECNFGAVNSCGDCPLGFISDIRPCTMGEINRWLEIARRFQRVRAYCKSLEAVDCVWCVLRNDQCYLLPNEGPKELPDKWTDKMILDGIKLIMEAK